MAVGSIHYQTVGYTDSSNSSLRKNYPIKKRYKQTKNTQYPIFPADFVLVSDDTYWFPFQGVAVSDYDFIPYEVSDEFGWSDDQEVRAKEISYSNPRTAKYDSVPSGEKIVWGNTIYVATTYTFDWYELIKDLSRNPYKSTRITKWRKFDDTDSVNWVQYWYHPLLRRFFVLENTPTLQELPDFDNASQSQWDEFIGDAKDMNLENFTFAKIKLLQSTGMSPKAAEATIASLTKIAISGSSINQSSNQSSSVVSSEQNINGYRDVLGQRSRATVVTSMNVGARASSGRAAIATVAPENLPTMIQRRDSGGPLTYEFTLKPNNVSYSNIGVTWTDIERVANFPLVDYKNNKLMKISFEFVVDSQPSYVSSLYDSCEHKLRLLKQMAETPELVVFTNFDSLFSGITNSSPVKYRQWAIAEMSFNSIQRTPGGSSSSDSAQGSISRATVSITIQEVRLNEDQLIFMPLLKKDPIPPTPPKRPATDLELCIRRATDELGKNFKIPPSACKGSQPNWSALMPLFL
jgi:hypothetical protein